MIYPTTTVFIIGSLALLFVGATPIPQSLAPGQNAPVEQRYKCTTATAPALPGIQLCSAWDAATQTTCSKWESVGCAADSLCIVKGDPASAIVLDRDTCIGTYQLVETDPRYKAA